MRSSFVYPCWCERARDLSITRLSLSAARTLSTALSRDSVATRHGS